MAAAANALTDPSDCAEDDVTFGVTGQFPAGAVIDSLVIVGVDPWTFSVLGTPGGRALLRYSLTYQPENEHCDVSITAYSQGDPRWATTMYDSTDSHIRTLGCALTSLAMVLTFNGHSVTPESLNSFMNAHNSFDNNGGVVWGRAVGALAPELIWKDVPRAEDRVALATAVCRGQPAIVRVPSLVQAGGSHFVMVTGAPTDATASSPLSQFMIVDPNGGGTGTLETYGAFTLRGFLPLRSDAGGQAPSGAHTTEVAPVF